MLGCPHFSPRGTHGSTLAFQELRTRGVQALRPGDQNRRRVHRSRRSLLGALFGIIFGAATVYLALKAGLTVSASIPIAVLSIAVFKKLGKSTILENNIVQTIGSAGESIAAGVVFTLPALLFLSDGRALLPATCRSRRSPPSAASSACS